MRFITNHEHFILNQQGIRMQVYALMILWSNLVQTSEV